MTTTEQAPPPVCTCGQPMRYDAETVTWACVATLDEHGWGRPTKGHIHYYPDEDWQRGLAPARP